MKALRVLVVEDDALVAMLLAELLAFMGHDVCAIEATEALAVATAIRCRPQLMIVDASLGEGSGLAAVDEILRIMPMPHVFVSGDASNVGVLRPGAVVIRKPFREADLNWAMKRALQAASAP